MNKLILVFVAALASKATFAQNILTSYSHSGSVTAMTTADEYVYTRGGSPRTGYYWYWRDYRRQTTSSAIPIPFNGLSPWVWSHGTYFQPNYAVAGEAGAGLSNSPTQAFYSVRLNDQFVWGPALGPHAAAAVSSSVQDIFTFTLAVDSRVTITPGGTSAFHLFVGGPPPDEGSSSTSGPPISMVLLAGTYYVELNATNSAYANTQTGTSLIPTPHESFGYVMRVTPAG